jgi:hypothetical protein
MPRKRAASLRRPEGSGVGWELPGEPRGWKKRPARGGDGGGGRWSLGLGRRTRGPGQMRTSEGAAAALTARVIAL